MALEIVGYSMVAVILWLMGGLMEWAGIGPVSMLERWLWTSPNDCKHRCESCTVCDKALHGPRRPKKDGA